MPIEFHCTQCNKLLRTGDETAGRQAQCPECGMISTIPGATPPSEPAAAPAPLPGGDSPFSGGQMPGRPTDPNNPYQSPMSSGYAMPGQAADPFAAQRLAGPAIALIVTAILGLVSHLGIAVLYGVVGVTEHPAMNRPGHHNQADLLVGIGIMETAAMVGIVMSILILVGALKMKNLQSRTWAFVAAILALCPCLSPCLLLGLPFGIWALVVLCDSSIKAAFPD
jgi:hypothetical protein